MKIDHIDLDAPGAAAAIEARLQEDRARAATVARLVGDRHSRAAVRLRELLRGRRRAATNRPPPEESAP